MQLYDIRLDESRLPCGEGEASFTTTSEQAQFYNFYDSVLFKTANYGTATIKLSSDKKTATLTQFQPLNGCENSLYY